MRRLFLILAGIFAVFGLAYIAIGIALDGGLTLLFGGVVTLLNALA